MSTWERYSTAEEVIVDIEKRVREIRRGLDEADKKNEAFPLEVFKDLDNLVAILCYKVADRNREIER